MALPPSRLSSTIRFRPEAGKNAGFTFVKNFRPQDAGNITLWLDASEYSTFTFSRGNDILIWGDKLNPQRTFVQASSSQPVYNATGFNGLPGVQFGATKGLKNSPAYPYTLTTNDSLTIFIVCQLTTPPTTKANIAFRAAEMYGGTPVPLDIGADPTNFFNWYGTFDLNLVANSANNQMVSNTQPTVVCFTIPSGSSYEKLYLNATSTPDLSAVTRGANSLNVQWDGVFIGTNNIPGFGEAYWDGFISEVIVYDSSLSDNDIAKMSAYLGQKWKFKDTLNTPYNTEDVYKPVSSGPSFYMKQYTA